LGRGDPTAIWFYQMIGGEQRFIDYYESKGEVITHYLSVLKSKGYQYDTLWLPHDSEHKVINTDKTVADICRANQFKVQITPNIPIVEGINAARLLLATCVIDAERCAPGIDALENYVWDYNQRLDEMKPTPLHNWASHGADGFRYAGVAHRSDKPKAKAIRYPNLGVV
jgi:phage terminase large subunit